MIQMLKYTPQKEEVPNVYDYAAETAESYENLLTDMKTTIEGFIASTQTKITATINDRKNWVPTEMYYNDFDYGWFRMRESGARERVSIAECSRYPVHADAKILFIVLDKKIDESDTLYGKRLYESPAIPLYTPFEDVLRNALIEIDTKTDNCTVYLGDPNHHIHLDINMTGTSADILRYRMNYRIGIRYVTLKDHVTKMVKDLNGAINTFKRSLGTVEYLLEDIQKWEKINE